MGNPLLMNNSPNNKPLIFLILIVGLCTLGLFCIQKQPNQIYKDSDDAPELYKKEDSSIKDQPEPPIIRPKPEHLLRVSPSLWKQVLFSKEDVPLNDQERQAIQDKVIQSLPTNQKKAYYAVINRHFGCHDDISYMAMHLNITFAEFNTAGLFAGTHVHNHEFITEEETRSPRVRELADKFCNMFTYVIIMDVNPDARFLLQRILDSPETCAIKKVIFITTNRFDYSINVSTEERQKHLILLKRISNLNMGPQIVWVQNNPVESKYAELKMGGKYIQYQTIRPFGFSSLPAEKTLSEEERQKVVSREFGANSDFLRILQKENVNVHPIGVHYGGPSVLAQYRAYIELPYQFSTMKQYENLAHGVVTLIPTPRFFMELYAQRKGHFDFNFWGFVTPDFDPFRLGNDFYKYSDYYHEDLRDYYYQFDSFQELKDMIARPKLDDRNLAHKSKKLFVKLRKEGLEKWAKLLDIPYKSK